MPARPARPLTAAVLLGATAVLAACSSSAASPTALPSTHQASPSPTASSTAAQALAAYRAMWVDIVAASTTANYQSASLADHMTGQALTTVTGNIAFEKQHGVIALGNVVLHPVVVSATSSTVKLQDCLDDRAWLNYYASTRKPVNNVPGGFRSTTATVQAVGGVWRVTQINSGADGTCHPSP